MLHSFTSAKKDDELENTWKKTNISLEIILKIIENVSTD